MSNEHVHKHFRSARALAEWARENTTAVSSNSGWGRQLEPGLRILERGDESSTKEAMQQVRQLNLRVESPRREWAHGIVGYTPDVSRYLTGRPDSMWTARRAPSDRTPLRIWVGLNSSAGLSGDELRKRGCTLAAFGIAMAQIRPVYLVPYVCRGIGPGSADMRRTREGYHTGTVSWDIRTSPLVMAELIGSLTRSEVSRGVGHAVCGVLDKKLYGGYSPIVADEANMRQLLGCAKNDLFLQQISIADALIDDPIAWLKDQVARYSEQESN